MDWEAVKAALAAGAGTRMLAAQYGVSRQAIESRAKRHGWQRCRVGSAPPPTLAAMEQILNALAFGESQEQVAKAAGVSLVTLEGWISSDAEFARLTKEAHALAGILNRRPGVVLQIAFCTGRPISVASAEVRA